jgi:hypothetical protein
VLVLAVLPTALAETVLYGGLGGHGVSSGPEASTNDGALVIVSQIDGSTSLVGHPAGVSRISGLAFGLDGVLFGATQAAGGFPPPPGPTSTSDLIRINPDTGTLISSVPIKDGADGISIADLAIQPTTGALYGIRGPHDRLGGEGKLYIIDTTTGVATLVGDTGRYFGSIAFAPDGTLYMSAAFLNTAVASLLTLNPANAAILTGIRTADFYGALAVRLTDGVIFGGNGDQEGVFKIDPTTGAATSIGRTGENFVGDFAFRSVGGPPAALDLNQHGLSGSWFEPATDGQGIEVEIFPTLGSTQVSWFTFDTSVGGADHQRWYTLSGPVVTGQPTALLKVYRNIGGNFNAPPNTSGVEVGTATLSFDTCTSGQLTYNFTDGSGRTGTIPLTRITQNVTCSTTSARPTNADFAFSGNWYNAATDGQGFTVEVNPINGSVFVPWYTYAPAGASAGAAGQRWYTASGGFTAGSRSIALDIFETTGGLFDMPTVPAPHSVKVGTGTLAFQSCTSATLAFNFTGGSSAGASGTIALARVGPVPPGCTL